MLRTERDRIIVGSGLVAGDRVCTSPLDAALEGMNVRVVEDAAQPSVETPETTPARKAAMNGAIAWFARNHVAANLLMALMVVGGLFSLPRIQQKTFPDIDVDIISVAVAYLGAAPEEVEQGVCVRIEEEINGLNGIEQITSSAAEGACGVSAELMTGYPVDRALAEIKNAVDSITTFPDETEKPIVSHVEIQPNRAADRGQRTAPRNASLKVFGERIRDSIASLPGVTQVELNNARDYEISIEVSEESLQRHRPDLRRGRCRGATGLPRSPRRLDQDAAAARSCCAPRARPTSGATSRRSCCAPEPTGRGCCCRMSPRSSTASTTTTAMPSSTVIQRVTVTVYRVGDQKVLELVDAVQAHLEELAASPARGPDHSRSGRTPARPSRDRLDILIRNGVSGFILVFVVLALFLRLKLAIWVSIGVPLSILGALSLFPDCATSRST